MRPLIAVSAAIELLPTAFGQKDCTRVAVAYTDAIYRAGGQPVLMPVVVDPPAGLLERFDGLLLTGGGDLDPTLYGEAPDPSVYGVRPERDQFEIALYREAIDRRLPVLAVCRGMQLVNVLRGGNLIQEIQPPQSHWQTNPGHEPSHHVDVSAGTRLAGVVGTAKAPVNSYHHQGLGRIGDDLRVTAFCGDVVEAVEATDIDLLGVQWHPEHMASADPRQQSLFNDLVVRAAHRQTEPMERTPCPTQ